MRKKIQCYSYPTRPPLKLLVNQESPESVLCIRLKNALVHHGRLLSNSLLASDRSISTTHLHFSFRLAIINYAYIDLKIWQFLSTITMHGAMTGSSVDSITVPLAHVDAHRITTTYTSLKCAWLDIILHRSCIRIAICIYIHACMHT